MNFRRVMIAAGCAVAFTTFAAGVQADDDERSVPLLPSYQQECASCHIAYPPAMLPASSWRRLMGDLAHHFGTDASAEPAVVAELSDWLSRNASHRRRASEPPEDRITRSRWFLHEHDEVAPHTWKSPAVRSAANCGACHRAAAQGEFDDDDVVIPR